MISDSDLELLSKYLDGELSSEETVAFKERLLSEPDLRSELDAMKQSDDLLMSFAKQMDHKPVPAEISDMIESSEPSRNGWMLAAAAVVVAVFAGLLTNQNHDTQSLDTLATGERGNIEGKVVEIVATFQHKEGQYCRELAMSDRREIVCRNSGGWQSVVSVPRSATPSGTYQPAGVEDIQAIDTYIEQHINGSVLEPSVEHALIDSGWQ